MQNTLSPHRSASPSFPIRTPTGRVIGRVFQEGGRRVLLRKVGTKELFRNLDAWPLGAHAVEQAQRLRVGLLRYLGDDGTYEIGFNDFLARAARFDFPHEPQFVLPRREWMFAPAPERPMQTGLLLEVAA